MQALIKLGKLPNNTSADEAPDAACQHVVAEAQRLIQRIEEEEREC